MTTGMRTDQTTPAWEWCVCACERACERACACALMSIPVADTKRLQHGNLLWVSLAPGRAEALNPGHLPWDLLSNVSVLQLRPSVLYTLSMAVTCMEHCRALLCLPWETAVLRTVPKSLGAQGLFRGPKPREGARPSS